MSRIVLSLLVDNTAGVLSRVAGLFSRRGYNIESLTVGVTADPRYSRMTVVSLGDHQVLEQIQKQLGKLEDVDLVVALPEQEEWTISTEEGITTANAMSSFAMKTADGRELSFLKDNCPIEDGALSEDSGDPVRVTYVTSEGMNFPVEIEKGQ